MRDFRAIVRHSGSEGKHQILPLLFKLINYHSFSLFPKETITLIGDKNPVYTIYAESLVKIFPDTWFIYIIRDFRDVFLSMRTFEFEAPSITLQGYRWKYIAKMGLRLRKKYLKTLMDPIGTEKMNLWKKELTDKQIRRFDHAVGKYAELTGYERKYKDVSYGLYLKQLPLKIYGYLLYKFMMMGFLLPYKISNWFSYKLPMLVVWYRKYLS
jgi:hypothetical protein